jgi:hypothetical protein
VNTTFAPKLESVPTPSKRKSLLNPSERDGFPVKVSRSGPIVRFKLTALFSPAVWLIAGYDRNSGLLTGYADLHGTGQDAEWGVIPLEFLECLNTIGVPIVQRTPKWAFKPTPLSACIDSKTGCVIV